MSEGGDRPTRGDPGALLLGDLAAIGGVLVLAGLLAGVLWRLAVTLPYAVRTARAIVVDQQQLAVRGQTDLWYVGASFLLALVAGFLLVWWRDRDELVTVLAGAVLSLPAGALAAAVGHLLGPEPVLPRARQMPPGSHVQEPLALVAHGAVVVWPLGFLIAAVALLWSSPGRGRRLRKGGGTGNDPEPEPAYDGSHRIGTAD